MTCRAAFALVIAVHELTRGDKWEEKPPRYEFSGPARDACWQLLGPPPEHPLHEEMRRQGKGR